MDIYRTIHEAHNLTPTEHQLGERVLGMAEHIQELSIKELAAQAHTSVASIHRFCKKLGLEGYKELKVELARANERHLSDTDVDINFPFEAGAVASDILPRMERLYNTTLRDTRELLSVDEVNRAAELVQKAQVVDIYTCSHNLYPARMFRDRVMSTGKVATCHEGMEQKIRTAISSDAGHVAIFVSYSGLNGEMSTLLPLVSSVKTPVIIIGTPYCAKLHPGFAAYLLVSDLESFTHRITQFASHIAVQYVLDTLFSCYFARNYEHCSKVLEASFPYTRLPGTK